MWFLLACHDSTLHAVDGSPPGTTDSSRASGDDTADDTADDTGDPIPCSGLEAEYRLPETDGNLSPYATVLAEDLDGGGAPDVLYETHAGRRGVSLLRGEDVVTGAIFPTLTFPDPVDSGQAAFAVGVAGDLDGDGTPEVAVAGVDGSSGDSRIAVWSAAGGSAPLATLALGEAQEGGILSLPEGPAPDFDGDGVPELVFTSTAQGAAVVYPGATLASGGTRSASAALLTIDPEHTFAFPTVAPDLDGDGLDDLLLGHYWPDTTTSDIRIVPATLAATGGDVTASDLDVLVTNPARFGIVDLEGDGSTALFILGESDSYEGTTGDVYGFPADAVTRTARGGASLSRDDASVRIAGTGRDYLGATIVPVTDEDCAMGLALSAHMADTVYLAGNAALRGGGSLEAADLPHIDGNQWFGYVVAGGQDIDGDGGLDLVLGGGTGMLLYLSPADAAGR